MSCSFEIMTGDTEVIEERKRLLDSKCDNDKYEKEPTSNFSRLAVLNILLVLVNLLLIISGFCLLVPFFPAEAKRKGLTIEETSVVFTCYQVTLFIMSLACGLLVSRETVWE